MNATVRHNEAQHRFEIEYQGQTAVADYRRNGNTLILTHTEVPVEFRGRGFADQLARAAFDYARSHTLEVEPICPFMAAWLRRHPQYQDLRARPRAPG